ncbi:hypothetical protein H4R33_003685 [Dimargaris cristalligena]|nr:hypothetical protein H4R33_003685 [Dimargaris cristalligena]
MDPPLSETIDQIGQLSTDGLDKLIHQLEVTMGDRAVTELLQIEDSLDANYLGNQLVSEIYIPHSEGGIDDTTNADSGRGYVTSDPTLAENLSGMGRNPAVAKATQNPFNISNQNKD